MLASLIIEKIRRLAIRGARQAEPSSLTALDAVIEDLRYLNQNTESDFLQIGGKLMEFLRAAEAISSGVNRLTLLISGEHVRHASDVISSALNRCRQMEARADQCSQDLKSLRADATSIRDSFASFRDFLSTFHVLSVLTRIETARLGGEGAGFGSLAEDVTVLAGSMGAKVDSVLGAAIQLNQRVEETIVYLSDVGVLLDGLSRVMNGVMSSLDAFSAQQEAASVLSGRLVSDSSSASASIRSAVTSIQFHDITRQQVEHVIEALAGVASRARPQPKSSSGLSREDGAVLLLEASQLADAQQKFASSVRRLLQNLDNFAFHVREMVGIGHSLLNDSENKQDSFFLQMEQCVGAVLHGAGSFDLAETATEIAAGHLGSTLAFMRDAAGEIRAIDYQLRRLALNASLQAAHIGAKGETLGVLAGSLQELSTKSRERSDSTGGVLDVMQEAVDRLLNANRVTAATLHPKQDDSSFAAEMHSTIDELHSWAEASFAGISEVKQLASQLCDDIAAAQNGFTVSRLFDDVVNRCRGRVMELVADAGSLSEDESAALGLHDLASHYTMQSEREVHAAVTAASNGVAPLRDAAGIWAVPHPDAAEIWAARDAGESAASPDATEILAPPAESGELGDNVELF